MTKIIKRVTEYYTDPKQDEPTQVTDNFTPDEKKEIRSDEGYGNYGCSECGKGGFEDEYELEKHRKEKHGVKSDNFGESLKQIHWTTESCCKKKTNEAKTFEKFVAQQIKTLQKKATESQSVDLLLGGIKQDGQKIEGTLAYAGVSLNNRLYLPEELAKGDGMTVPLIINHGDVAGAEDELYRQHRAPPEVVKALEQGEEIKIGEISLTWNGEENVLYYTGIVTDQFWIKEMVEGNMAVSLGMYYDADSPEYCGKQECYTIIKNGEFHEVSLVWNPGFAIATIEAVEVLLKKKAMEVLDDMEAKEDVKGTIKKIGKYIDPSYGANKILGFDPFEEDEETEDIGEKKKPMNADNPSTITKIAKNKTLISPPEEEDYGEVKGYEFKVIVTDEAVGPHSLGYGHVYNEPTSSPEITGLNATQYSKPPNTRLSNSQMNRNLKEDSLSIESKKYLKQTKFD